MVWDSTYNNARMLYYNAINFDNINLKASYHKMAHGAAHMLPDSYPKKRELIIDMESYAYACEINLSEGTAFK